MAQGISVSDVESASDQHSVATGLMPGRPVMSSIAAAALYALLGGPWIVYSDALVAAADPAASHGYLQTGKGLVFVLGTAALIYWLSRREAAAKVRLAGELDRSNRARVEILDAVPDIIFTLDRAGRITTFNRQARTATGYGDGDLRDRAATDLFSGTDVARVRQAIAKVVSGTPTVLRADVVRKDGSKVAYEFSGAPLTDPLGRIVGVVGAGRDITEQIRLEARLQDRLRGADAVLEQAVGAIAALVEIRDPYLSGHQARVTKLALAVAGRLGIEGDRLRALRLAGLCHDIGKIRVPAEILNSPARLTEAEFAIIKTHPETGYQILRTIDFPWPVATIVRQHHERLDGTGYPHGLSGDEICLEARILAVADTVEAMTAHRPYRPAIGFEAAIEELRRGRGVWFDAAVVDAMLAIRSEAESILSERPPRGPSSGAAPPH